MADKDYLYATTRSQRREKNAKRKFWKRTIGVMIVVFAICLGLFGTFLYDFFYGNEVTFSSVKRKLPIAESKVNILIIGYDSEVNGKPRSDTIMLASFDLTDNAVGIVSIPRDTRVQLPGRSYHTKINSAFSDGGAELSAEVVGQFLGVPIDYYVTTNFDGFEAMIDSLGGIEIDVEEDMHYDDHAGNLHIHLSKGRQILDGEKAIQYVRYRDKISADLGRIDRQQKLIKEALDQFLTPEFVLKMPKLIANFKESIHTNMSFRDMMNLAKLVKNVQAENIKTAKLPGIGEYVNNVSYFLHDEAKTQQLVHELIASKEFVANSKVRVAVFNGNGQSLVATRGASDLQLYGFTIGRTANADHFNYKQSLVLYRSEEPSKEAKEIARIIRGELTPISSSSYVNNANYKDYDILVILGKDFSENS